MESKPIPVNRYKHIIKSLFDYGLYLYIISALIAFSSSISITRVINAANAAAKDPKLYQLLQDVTQNLPDGTFFYRLSFPNGQNLYFRFSNASFLLPKVRSFVLSYLIHANNGNYTESIVSSLGYKTIEAGLDSFSEAYSRELGNLIWNGVGFVAYSFHWTIVLLVLIPLPFYTALYTELRYHSVLLSLNCDLYLPNRIQLLIMALVTASTGSVIQYFTPVLDVPISESAKSVYLLVTLVAVEIPVFWMHLITFFTSGNDSHVETLIREVKSLCKGFHEAQNDYDEEEIDNFSRDQWYNWVKLTSKTLFMSLKDAEMKAHFEDGCRIFDLNSEAVKKSGEDIHKKSLRLLEFINAK